MVIAVDWPTLTFSVPQSDLTLVSGTLYDMDTEVDFRQAINAIMASEEGIVFEDPITHNTEVTVAGITYARTIELINGYSVTFTPDSQWTARLGGSNNNIFDVENGQLNQNQVQVIPNNSAGLQIVETGTSGLTPSESATLSAILLQTLELWQLQGLDVSDAMTVTLTTRRTASGDIDITVSGDGETTSTLTRQP